MGTVEVVGCAACSGGACSATAGALVGGAGTVAVTGTVAGAIAWDGAKGATVTVATAGTVGVTATSGVSDFFGMTTCSVAASGVLCCTAIGAASCAVTGGRGRSSCVSARPKRWVVMLRGLRATAVSGWALLLVADRPAAALASGRVSLRKICTATSRAS